MGLGAVVESQTWVLKRLMIELRTYTGFKAGLLELAELRDLRNKITSYRCLEALAVACPEFLRIEKCGCKTFVSLRADTAEEQQRILIITDGLSSSSEVAQLMGEVRGRPVRK